MQMASVLLSSCDIVPKQVDRAAVVTCLVDSWLWSAGVALGHRLLSDSSPFSFFFWCGLRGRSNYAKIRALIIICKRGSCSEEAILY